MPVRRSPAGLRCSNACYILLPPLVCYYYTLSYNTTPIALFGHGKTTPLHYTFSVSLFYNRYGISSKECVLFIHRMVRADSFVTIFRTMLCKHTYMSSSCTYAAFVNFCSFIITKNKSYENKQNIHGYNNTQTPHKNVVCVCGHGSDTRCGIDIKWRCFSYFHC